MQDVRDFTLELLRHGPAHNHLLSPLTQYLALCGDHGAVSLTVPFEHREFLALLGALRYQRDAGAEADRRAKRITERERALGKISEETSKILDKIPGLIAELAHSRGDKGQTLNHLRLVVSASELALLPFETALAPAGCPGAGDPMLLQPDALLTLTRETRQGGIRNFQWPRRARILFAIASPPGVGPVPAREHVAALRQAIEPWLGHYEPENKEARRKEIDRILTILPQATIADIERACAKGHYTHVHILAHGAERTGGVEQSFGLAFHRAGDPGGMDVVDGARLATALRAHRDCADGGGLSHPAVVTVASCDSGNVGSVIVPGASVAHQLHEAGIPFVVASQFPLSFAGSVLMTEVLYERLLWGEDPRCALHELRMKLFGRDADAHDWASLVAYASFPHDLDTQLVHCRYARSKAAINTILKNAKRLLEPSAATDEELILLEQKLERAHARLPDLPNDRAERTGLEASTEKQKAEILWNALRGLKKGERKGEKQKALQSRYDNALAAACRLYREAFLLDMSSHWTATQHLALCLVVHKRACPTFWTVARFAAERALESGDRGTMIWAHGSLAELELLKPRILPEDGDSEDRTAERVLDHIRPLAAMCGQDTFPIFSTRRQFQRYLDWWKIDGVRGTVEAVLDALV